MVRRLSRVLLSWAVLLWCALARAAEELPEARGDQYQGRSAREVGSGASNLWSTFVDFLHDLNITKAKVLIGLGAIGALYTLNKNKRQFTWGALALLAYALIAVGAIAVYKGWPALN